MTDTLTRGDIAVRLLRAAIAGDPFPPDVPDTPPNRTVWDDTRRDIANLPPGVSPDIPFDYNTMPDADGTVSKGASDPSDPNPVEAEHVMNQMRRNYPENALGWMRDARWVGPVQVPLDRIDFDDRDSWAADHDKARVKHFAKRIKRGEAHLHPVVAVQEPGGDNIKVIDGHHRVLAYEKLGQPVKAYVGFVDSDGGPWDETHVHQFHQCADPGNKAAQPDAVKVGPKGYIHGWIFVGAPGVGATVHHPQHGAGTVTGHDGKHTTVRFHGGKEHSFETRAASGGDGGHFAPRPTPPGARADELARGTAKPKDLTDDELRAADTEFARRAELLGKPGQLSRTHRAVRDELEARKPKALAGGGHRDAIERVARMGGVGPGPIGSSPVAGFVTRMNKANAKSSADVLAKMDPEARERLHASLRKSANSELKINVSRDTLDHLVTDGRLKPLRELADEGKSAKGSDYLASRTALEKLTMGYRDDTPSREWPIYGTGNSGEAATGYGEITVHLKDAVRDRTSVTMGDSLNDMLSPVPMRDAMAGGLSDEKLAAASSPSSMHSASSLSGTQSHQMNPWLTYMEAQIHGGVSMDDVDHIELPRHLGDVATALQAKGIDARIAPTQQEREEAELEARIAAIRAQAGGS